MCDEKEKIGRIDGLIDANMKKVPSPMVTVDSEVQDMDCFNFSHNLSPIAGPILPRKLDFNSLDDEEMCGSPSPVPAAMSPPYKRVRALRLFDSPLTPKSMLQKCSTPTQHQSRSRLFPSKTTHTSVGQSTTHSQPASDAEDSALGSLPPDALHLEESPKPILMTGTYPVINTSVVINPFTPDGQLLNKKKRSLSKTPTLWGRTSPELPAKRLKESNISRYNVEFMELGVIGCGQFGRVAKCLNKLDGVVYAVKRSLRPVAGSAAERAALNEVYAHAVLGKHPHVVRYYSAWAEDDHMVIQNEYCDGGSLQDLIATGPLPESELLILLQHIASGLQVVADDTRSFDPLFPISYIHGKRLVHMDVKPGNIFVCENDGTPPSSPARERNNNQNANEVDDDGDDDVVGDVRAHAEYDAGDEVDAGAEGDEDSDGGSDRAVGREDFRARRKRKYKIGDLGHVTCVSAPMVEEGDCRYLPREVLQEDFTNLTKADIFAFDKVVSILEKVENNMLMNSYDIAEELEIGHKTVLTHSKKGLTLFEAAGGGPLPKNGPLWHEFRDGRLPNLGNLSQAFNQLLRVSSRKLEYGGPRSTIEAFRVGAKETPPGGASAEHGGGAPAGGVRAQDEERADVAENERFRQIPKVIAYELRKRASESQQDEDEIIEEAISQETSNASEDSRGNVEGGECDDHPQGQAEKRAEEQG
ncbi:Wee1-like protein kinase [Eumeta japonica]|uniref:non-specific protein-tyrosine kinase n=1 Tax=Eumeta variegata TaxID=151549 RepID=A0A4C1YIV5_EUMVA|nr:Wee1-like protein kinase [Eumeta japonica]